MDSFGPDTDMIKEWLDAGGVESANAVAGFCGGLINIFWYKQAHPYDITGALVVGTIMGAYFGPIIGDIIHMPHVFTSCVVGGGGIQFFGVIFTMVRTRLTGNNSAPAEKGKSDGSVS